MQHIDTVPAGTLARTTNVAGRDLIKTFEGLRLKAYKDVAGRWTMGYGHTRTARAGMTITEEQADALLAQDMLEAERSVSHRVRVRLSNNQYAALVSFVFNVGDAQLRDSTLLRALNYGWYEHVPPQLMRWTRVRGEELGGLSRRRRAECALWNTPDTPDPWGDGALR